MVLSSYVHRQSATNLTIPPLDVIRRLRMAGGDEQVLGGGVLHHPAHEHEYALLAGASRLGHVVGDDEDSVAAAQFPDQLFYRGGALGIEGRTGLVHQQQRGLHRQQAGDAQLLLLLQGQLGGLAPEPVLERVPQQHGAQGLLDDLLLATPPHARAAVVQAVAEQDVVADGDGQGVGALEHHAHLLAHLDQLHRRVVDVARHHLDAALDAHVTQALIDAVDAAQQGGLAAPGGADQGGDQALADRQVHLVQGLEGAVPEVEPLGADGVLRGGI